LAGYLADITSPDVVITCNMPNAGHTYIDRSGNKMIHKVLPNGIVSPGLRYVMIGPGAVIDLDQLEKEIKQAREFGYLIGTPILIHPGVTILMDDHKQVERENLNAISSTMQGSMTAMIHKMARCPTDNPTIKVLCGEKGSGGIVGYDGAIVVIDHGTWARIIDEAHLIQAEGSQGFSLGINQVFYPYCTSRECTPYRLMSDMGLPTIKGDNLKIHGTLRTYPIRVGNTEGGYSGGCYPDQSEVSWEGLGVVPEKTTVTQRVRRIFTFSRFQLADALRECRPDHLFLNFCNYMDERSLGILVEDIETMANMYGARISHLGYGPTVDDVVEYHHADSRQT